jgi:hypothetical protein
MVRLTSTGDGNDDACHHRDNDTDDDDHDHSLGERSCLRKIALRGHCLPGFHCGNPRRAANE